MPQNQTPMIELGKGKKADKDYDGDGKIESGTAEYMGSRDKAIKKAMAKEEFIVAEGEEKEKKLDVMKGKNKVVVNPPMNEQQSAMEKPKTGPSPEEKRQLDNKKKDASEKNDDAKAGNANAKTRKIAFKLQ